MKEQNSFSGAAVNVAPSSTHGHMCKATEQVIALDLVNETFRVKGSSTLESANHTTTSQKDSGLVTCQTVYDPFAKLYAKSRD